MNLMIHFRKGESRSIIMGRTKRAFSSEFKTKIVLEAIKGEKQIKELASEFELAPNLIRNWKKEFLDNASVVFDDKREDNLKEKLKDARNQKDEYAKKVDQLTLQINWLKKNLKKLLSMDERVSLVQSLVNSNELSVSTAAELMDINRTTVYYKSICASDAERDTKVIIDNLHLEHPAWGSRQVSKQRK